ncbi:MAG: transposase [Deltaproteobacteria bacterium]|nr:transposase [Deltaproteobacteria bacterium]
MPHYLVLPVCARLAQLLLMRRACLLKESFDAFWTYTSSFWAGWYLDKWCAREMKSRPGPIKKFVGTLREHKELPLNGPKAKKEISSGVVEGLNTNVKLALRKARGFKSYHVAETALYQDLSVFLNRNSPTDSVDEAFLFQPISGTTQSCFDRFYLTCLPQHPA